MSFRTDRIPVVALILTLFLAVMVLGACGGSDPTTTTSAVAPEETVTSSTEAPAESGETVLEVVGPTGSKSYTLEQLQALKVTEGYGGMKSSTGRITPPAMQKGVLIEDLLAEVGGLPDDMAVSIIAKDGYEMTMSAAQLRSGDFLTYDMVDGTEKPVDERLQVMITYEADGRALNPESEGTLRMGIVGQEKNQVTDGHWWVKWVVKVEVKAIEQDWSLTLSGAITEEMDKATFESGANPGCHGTDWTDAAGEMWTGIPLYLLVGRVDDEVAHEGPAYNRELATAGYDVQLIGADGTMVTIGSEEMYYVKELIVAHKLNGAVLGEDYWPLRLVGEGIPEADMIGQIAEIKVLIPTD